MNPKQTTFLVSVSVASDNAFEEREVEVEKVASDSIIAIVEVLQFFELNPGEYVHFVHVGERRKKRRSKKK